jgi:REP element-mobilizing transposase RayT
MERQDVAITRLHVPGGCYHVILRGNHREDLFATADDRYELNGIVAQTLEKYQARAHAFCWMTSHPPAHTNLFERRYKAWLVDTDAYFIALIRYIHSNPVRAGSKETNVARVLFYRYDSVAIYRAAGAFRDPVQ